MTKVATLDDVEETTSKEVSRRAIAFHFFSDPINLFAVLFLCIIIISAFGANFFAPYDPLEQNLRLRNMPPLTAATSDNGFLHIFGTDPLGRDVFSRMLYGARVSLTVGFSSAIISGLLGSLLGIIAGYRGGLVDTLIMRFVDVQMSIPVLLLALLILFVVGPGFINLVVVLSIARWMVYTRIARGLALSYRESPAIEAAIAIGCTHKRIILRHLVPNVASPLLILTTLEIATLILSEAGLSFLGFGIQPPQSSWGLMISSGRAYIESAWWIVTFPGLVIFLTTISLNLLATSLQSIGDPVQRSKWLAARRNKGNKARLLQR